MARQANTQEASARPKRVPVSSRNRLEVKGQDPNYAYRIVNDDDDRVARFQEGGWELCSSETVGALGNKRVDDASAVGSAAHFSVGKGTKAVLMRIPKDWALEDQRTKLDEIAAVEATMKQDKSRADYGSNQF